NGYVRGEGCGVVVLKRLKDAVEDQDRILAVIRGSAVNHDGRSNGLTVPNCAAQEAVLRQALASAGLQPGQAGYLEAHGPGTSLGDPIELQAVNAVLGQGRSAAEPLVVGSVKTNIGHLEAAAGVAGLIKAILSLEHGQIPPHLHFRQPNPFVPWKDIPIEVPTDLRPWPGHNTPRRAGVSSFGFSGTNAHVILHEAPVTVRTGRELERATPVLSLSGNGEADCQCLLLPLSGHSAEALRAVAESYRQLLASEVSSKSGTLTDVCYSAAK